ncbi:response regulator [Marinobacter fonticola]|uniref:response regulator n=1 Tax=Marinobacter fonticola TaxID=2603215 RepID=UPI0011E7DA1B|nr:response regulator [Marinobacter fonticola]
MARGQALIIDDSSTARIILARLLQKADLVTKGAVSAEEGFQMLQAEPYDLIFLDHLLPGMNGFQALERLKNNPDTAHIPVFMYTSQNADKYLEDAKARGASGVISKQVDRDQLLAMIESILAGAEEAPLLEFPDESAVERGSPNPDELMLNRRLTGRLSTLEIAYEETHDELHQLKGLLTTIQTRQEAALEQRYRKLKLYWLLTVVAFFIAACFFTFKLIALEQVMDSISQQFTVVQEIIAALVDLNGGEEG